MSRSSLHLFFIATSAVALFACSSETTSGSGTTSAGGSAATSTGTGGESTATSSGTGGSATTGTGTSTGTGSAVMNACTNAADAAVLMTKDAKTIAADCGKANLAAEPATFDCIKKGTGLSDDCTSCYDDSVVCASDNCLSKCLTDPMSQPCTDCRAMYCTPAFKTCSGLDKG